MLVIGLGRFGGRLALELIELGHDVVGVDEDPAIVQQYAPLLTKTLSADTTRPEVLAQLGATDFNHVVVAIGNVEASILTVAELVSMGVRDVWAKAATDRTSGSWRRSAPRMWCCPNTRWVAASPTR